MLVCVPQVRALDVTGPADVFSIAAELLAAPGRDPRYTVQPMSRDGGTIVSSCGIAFQTKSLRTARVSRRDTVLVCGASQRAMELASRDTRLLHVLRRARAKAERMGSICTGAFVLAATGLLDGRRAATHWSAAERLVRFRPAVDVDRDAIFVRDGSMWTSAGITSGIDMALAMVERDHGRRLADRVAGELVLYVRRPGFQSQFSDALVAQTSSSDPLGPSLAWARANFGNDAR